MKLKRIRNNHGYHRRPEEHKLQFTLALTEQAVKYLLYLANRKSATIG